MDLPLGLRSWSLAKRLSSPSVTTTIDLKPTSPSASRSSRARRIVRRIGDSSHGSAVRSFSMTVAVLVVVQRRDRKRSRWFARARLSHGSVALRRTDRRSTIRPAGNSLNGAFQGFQRDGVLGVLVGRFAFRRSHAPGSVDDERDRALARAETRPHWSFRLERHACCFEAGRMVNDDVGGAVEVELRAELEGLTAKEAVNDQRRRGTRVRNGDRPRHSRD